MYSAILVAALATSTADAPSWGTRAIGCGGGLYVHSYEGGCYGYGNCWGSYANWGGFGAGAAWTGCVGWDMSGGYGGCYGYGLTGAYGGDMGCFGAYSGGGYGGYYGSGYNGGCYGCMGCYGVYDGSACYGNWNGYNGISRETPRNSPTFYSGAPGITPSAPNFYQGAPVTYPSAPANPMIAPNPTAPPAAATPDAPAPIRTPAANPGPGAAPANPPAANPNAGSAKLMIELPENAKLFVDGTPIVAKAGTNEFTTPVLSAGQGYFYNVRVEVIRDGKPSHESRQIVVRAGEVVRENFQDGPAITTVSK